MVTKSCNTSHWIVTHVPLMLSFQFSANHKGRQVLASLKRKFWEESVTPNFPLILQSVWWMCQGGPVNNYNGLLTTSIENNYFWEPDLLSALRQNYKTQSFTKMFTQGPPLDCIVSHTSPIYAFSSCFVKIPILFPSGVFLPVFRQKALRFGSLSYV
jgi:hypothetical protein